MSFRRLRSNPRLQTPIEVGTKMEPEIASLNVDHESEPSSPTAETAAVIKAAGQRFLNNKGINLKIVDAERFFREKPLTSIGIAAAAGFIVAGGLTTRLGLAVLAIFGRKAGRELAANIVSGAVRSLRH
jgi:hypothetical protein